MGNIGYFEAWGSREALEIFTSTTGSMGTSANLPLRIVTRPPSIRCGVRGSEIDENWCERRCRSWDCPANFRIMESRVKFSSLRWLSIHRHSFAATISDYGTTTEPWTISSHGSGTGGFCLARRATTATGRSIPRTIGFGDHRDVNSFLSRFGSIRRPSRGARRRCPRSDLRRRREVADFVPTGQRGP